MRSPRECRAALADFAHELGVFVRPANLEDATHLIQLNKHFRREMAQWEAGLNGGGECQGYPVLDFDDVHYILHEESPKNLMVLGRNLEGEECFIGYSYSYAEHWESTTEGPVAPPQGILSPRPNRGKGQRSNKANKTETDSQSLYIAELFISDSERGLGLGELLLAETLLVHSDESLRSHLFVSSQNVGAVKCYQKFGYVRGLKPSGDVAHDLVMELASSKISVAEASSRFEKQLAEGTVGARRRRCAAPAFSRTNSRTSAAPPPQLSGAKVVLSSHAQESSPTSDSRASSRATQRSSPQPVVTLCPRPTRSRAVAIMPATHKDTADHGIRRATRAAKAALIAADDAHSPASHASSNERSSKRSPMLSTATCTTGHAHDRHVSASTIQGRQRKTMKVDQSKTACRSMQLRTEAKLVKEAAHQRKSSRNDDSAAGLESNDLTHKMNRRSKGKSKFMITLFTDNKKRIAEERIEALGGKVSRSEFFDADCTHVVSARPATTEKYLCAIAAGKHLMHPSYIEDSYEAGVFLPEEDYEWCNVVDNDNDDDLDDYHRDLARAPLLWRQRTSKPQKGRNSIAICEDRVAGTNCFEGISALLLSTEAKEPSFAKMLAAGGGTLCGNLMDVHGLMMGTGSALCLDDVTHVFVSRDLYDEDGKCSREFESLIPVLHHLHSAGARFLYEEFLVEKVVHNVDLRLKSGKVFLVNLDALLVDKCGIKRKADQALQDEVRSKRASGVASALRFLVPSQWR